MRCVAVLYHFFPHYRLPVMQCLDRSKKYKFVFIGQNAADDGIVELDTSQLSSFVDGPYFKVGPFYFQWAVIAAALSRNYDVMVMLGNPNFITTWIGAVIGRMTGKKILFWTHGWLRREGRIKSFIRNSFLRLSHKVLVYGERAVQLGVDSGFPASKISVIYNSLDAEDARTIFTKLEHGEGLPHRPQALFTNPERPLIICTARLTAACRFDLLFTAAVAMRQRGTPINIVLVGDGPERSELEQLSREMNVDVHFFGSCYDEEVLGAMIYHADLTVSPGKIGLTAMHSLMYGTPAITHGDLDRQMPEVEAIEQGVTGLLFRRNDAEDLAAKITDWFEISKDRAAVREACRKTIDSIWNPNNQARLIEAAIDDVVANVGRNL